MVLPPIRRGHRIVAIVVMAAAVALILLTRAACSAWEARNREDLAAASLYRDMACACMDRDCARRVARLPAFDEFIRRTEEADDAHMEAWMCLMRFSRTCTGGDLIDDRYDPGRSRR